MKKLIVTLKDRDLLQRVYNMPKNFRGRFVEAALAAFLQTSEGMTLYGFLRKKPLGSDEAGDNNIALDADPPKSVTGDF